MVVLILAAPLAAIAAVAAVGAGGGEPVSAHPGPPEHAHGPDDLCSRSNGRASARVLPDQASYRAQERVHLRYQITSAESCVLPSDRRLVITDESGRAVYIHSVHIDCSPGPCRIGAAGAELHDEWDQIEVFEFENRPVPPGRYTATTTFFEGVEEEPVMSDSAEFEITG